MHSGPMQVKFGKGDQDLATYFDSLERGKRAEQAKNLMRLGLAVQGLNILQLLIEKGIVDPAAITAASDGGHQDRAASKEQSERFLANIASSWAD